MKTIFIILLASCSVVFARLGESNAEIFRRYGAVQDRTETGTNTWTGTYMFKEYIVIVYFRDNKSEAEALRPISSREFSDEERDAMMKSIGGDGDWILDDSTYEFLSKTWINSKNHSVAYVKDGIMKASTLIVASREYCQRMEAEKKTKDKKKADGF
jgi:uncharacterized DUF497 family protein